MISSIVFFIFQLITILDLDSDRPMSLTIRIVTDGLDIYMHITRSRGYSTDDPTEKSRENKFIESNVWTISDCK
jgi:hypothetical protein